MCLPAASRRAGGAVLLAFLAFSGLQCVQDLFTNPREITFTFDVTPGDSAVVNVGDTVQPFTGTLTADGRSAGFTLGCSVISGQAVARADTAAGCRLFVTGRGEAQVRLQPRSVSLPVDTIARTVRVVGVVPRIALSTARTEDTLYSLLETATLQATARTRHGDEITGAPITWRQVSGGNFVTLLDAGTGSIRADSNGVAVFEASVDTAHAQRTVRVRQRPTTLALSVQQVRLRAVGQTFSLGAAMRDARTNAVANLSPTWTSRGPSVVSVTAGMLTAVGEGAAYVVASFTDASLGASVSDSTAVIVQQARLGLLSGDAQTGTVGSPLGAPLVVQLADGSGAALRDSGVAVVFRVTGGGGHFGSATDTLRTADTVRTDVQGQARSSPTLGRLVGPNAISAQGPGLAGPAVAFTATGTPAPLKTFLADSGVGQSGTVGQPLARAFVVVARDTFGNAVSGVPARFVVRSGGGKLNGTLDSVDATADATGRVRATLTVGQTAGPNEVDVTAFAAGNPYQRFTATGTPGPAKRLAFTVQPDTIVAGVSFVPAVQVTVRDTFGNRASGATNSVTLSIAAGTGTAGAALGGTKALAAVDGLASFGVLTVDRSGAGFRLVAVSDGLVPDTSAPFAVSAGAADHMMFLAPPRGARAGAPVYPPVQVAVVDASGNVLSSFAGDVALSIGRVPATGSDRYFGTPVVSAVAGVATFSDFGIQTAAPGYKLRAATSGLVPILSDLFDVSGPPDTLQLVSGNTQGGIVNETLADSLVVRVLDENSYAVPGDTVVFRVTFGDAHFGGTDSVVVLTGAGGRAAAALRLGPTTGSDTVVVTSRSLAGLAVTFAATAVEAGYRLEFVTQPGSLDLGSFFSPPVQVRVRDGFGNTVTGATAVVTLAVAAGTGRAGATLTGATSVSAASGIATFAGVGVSRSGSGYQITATATGIAAATSDAFDVRQVPASLVKDWGDLQNGIVGTNLNDNFVTRVLDAAGDPVAGDTVIYKVTGGPGSFAGVDSAIAVTDNLGRALAGVALGDTPGTVTVTARSARLAGWSVTYTASATAAGRALEFVTQPATIVAGATFTPAVQVRVYDPETGTTDATAATLVRVSPYGVTLTGALEANGSMVVAAVNGVATFSGLGVAGPVGTNKRLVAGAQGFALDAESAEFEVTVGAPARLAIEFSHGTVPADQGFMEYVRILDASGNLVPTATNTVTLSLVGGTAGSHLRGNVVADAVDGVASFYNLNVDSAGFGYALRAESPGLTGVIGPTFDVAPGRAHHLTFAVQPNGVAAGAAMSPAVEVLVQDSVGNTVSTSNQAVTLVFGANPVGATLLGTTSVAALGGVAQFFDLRIRRPGPLFTLVASSPGLPSVTSNSFYVATAPASRLVFVEQPTTALLGEIIVPAVQVAIQDSVGNVVTLSYAPITLAVTPGTGGSGASLAGTLTQTATAGVATFSDLSIATYGGDYSLTAMSSGLASAVSNPFDILTATSNRLVVISAPTSADAGEPFAVSVEIRNAAGVKVATATDEVALSITGSTGTAGAHLRGPLAATAVAGVAVFNGVSIDSAGAGYTLTARAPGLFSGTSAPLGIMPAGLHHVEFRIQPTSRTAGNVFSPAIQVVARDSLGNLQASESGQLTMGITPGTGTAGATLAGTTTGNFVNGVATFADLSIATAGAGYSLTAAYSAPPLTAVSTTFSIVPGPAASIAISPPDPATLVGGGSTLQLAAAEYDAYGNLLTGPAVHWNFSNGFIARVDQDGLVTAGGPGQAEVIADSGAAHGYTLITVVNPELAPVNLWVPMASGTTADLSAVWGSYSRDVYVTGQTTAGNPTIIHLGYDQVWRPEATGASTYLSGLGGLGESFVLASGSFGQLLTREGRDSDWRPVTSGTSVHLAAVWAASHANVFAVGENGTIGRYDLERGTFELMPSGMTGWLWGVFGTSATNVFAVGQGGAILHYDGSAWSAMTTPTTEHIFGIWGTSANSVYAATGHGVLHWNGSTWTLMSGSESVSAGGVWGSSDNDVYVASGNAVWRYDGNAWVRTETGVAADLGAVWGAPDDGAVFVVGRSGTVLRGVRGATVAVTPATPTLTALGATQQLAAEAREPGGAPVGGVTFAWSSDNPGVATVDAGTGLVTAVANGTATITATAAGGAAGSTTVTVSQVAKTVRVTPAGASVSGVGATQSFSVVATDSLGNDIASPSASWASLNPNVAAMNTSTGVATAVASGQVTVSATVGEVTGYALLTVAIPGMAAVASWSEMASGTDQWIEDLWGSSSSEFFAVGQSGTVLRYDGTAWSPMGSGTGQYLSGAWGTSGSDVYAVGYSGTILRCDGTTWSRMSSPTSEQLMGVWAASSSEVYVVGVAGTILRYDGTSWSPMASGTNEELHRVWGTSGSDVYAVGSGGTILHYNGTAWSTMASGTSQQLWGLWGTSGSGIYAVGYAGTILRFDGANWAPMTSGISEHLSAIWGTSDSDVYAVGVGGTILHLDGAGWSSMASTGRLLLGVWGTSNSDVYAVGSAGTILRGVR